MKITLTGIKIQNQAHIVIKIRILAFHKGIVLGVGAEMGMGILAGMLMLYMIRYISNLVNSHNNPCNNLENTPN